jgi:hypothetical protein
MSVLLEDFYMMTEDLKNLIEGDHNKRREEKWELMEYAKDIEVLHENMQPHILKWLDDWTIKNHLEKSQIIKRRVGSDGKYVHIPF